MHVMTQVRDGMGSSITISFFYIIPLYMNRAFREMASTMLFILISVVAKYDFFDIIKKFMIRTRLFSLPVLPIMKKSRRVLICQCDSHEID